MTYYEKQKQVLLSMTLPFLNYRKLVVWTNKNLFNNRNVCSTATGTGEWGQGTLQKKES